MSPADTKRMQLVELHATSGTSNLVINYNTLKIVKPLSTKEKKIT